MSISLKRWALALLTVHTLGCRWATVDPDGGWKDVPHVNPDGCVPFNSKGVCRDDVDDGCIGRTIGASDCTAPSHCGSRGLCSAKLESLAENLFAVWAADHESIWATGQGGTIVRFHNGFWQRVDADGIMDNLYAVHGRGPNDIWFVGDKGAIAHWDGTKVGRVNVTYDPVGSNDSMNSDQPLFSVLALMDGGVVVGGTNRLDFLRGTSGVATRLTMTDPAGGLSSPNRRQSIAGQQPAGEIIIGQQEITPTPGRTVSFDIAAYVWADGGNPGVLHRVASALVPADAGQPSAGCVLTGSTLVFAMSNGALWVNFYESDAGRNFNFRRMAPATDNTAWALSSTGGVYRLFFENNAFVRYERVGDAGFPKSNAITARSANHAIVVGDSGTISEISTRGAVRIWNP